MMGENSNLDIWLVSLCCFLASLLGAARQSIMYGALYGRDHLPSRFSLVNLAKEPIAMEPTTESLNYVLSIE